MITCISPIDGSIVASRPVASDAEITAALAAARKAQADWRRVPVAKRAAILSRAVDAMLAMKDEIAPELTLQMGRPIRYAAGELKGFEERARHMIGIAEVALAPVVPEKRDGFTRFIRREPTGVVFTIAPWNYPYLTAVNSVIPALMAGNAVILKHAAQTLLVGERFQMAMDRAGLPKGLFRTLTLNHAATLKVISGGHVNQVCLRARSRRAAPSSARRRAPSPASA
jgi:acyl-CoA reductase-like NAD-dependent aldehyde dehydrogenase